VASVSVVITWTRYVMHYHRSQFLSFHHHVWKLGDPNQYQRYILSKTYSTFGSGNLGPSEVKLQIFITTDKTVLDLKHAIADKSDVEADRQRLIYSGTYPS